MFCVVAPLLQENEYGALPEIATFNVPLALPQTAETIASVTTGGGASATATESVAVQLFESVTVTLYVPAEIFIRSSVVAPLSHKNEKGNAPFATLISTRPFDPPHVVLTCVWLSDGGVTAFTTADAAKIKE